jgi:hypothetical protein
MDSKLAAVIATSSLVLGAGALYAQSQDKYTLKVPGGIAFAELRGYESWETIAISQNGGVMAVIVGNPKMIEALKAGIPANAQPFPDGAMMAKVHWAPKKNDYPGNPSVPDTLANVDFMVKDGKRFADSGGWGYAVFEYDAVSKTFRPGDLTSSPPQGNDAKCGFACHTIVKARDYVFTEYAPR